MSGTSSRLAVFTAGLFAATVLHAEQPAPTAPKPAAGAPKPAAAAAQAAPTSQLAELAWLEGHWRDESDGMLSEEIWTAPAGDSLMGMWRFAQGGQVRVFELLVIKAEEGKLVLRFRHFDPKLIAREEKEQPLAWPILRAGPREVVFEGAEASGKGTARLTYRRPDEDTLVAILEKEGKPQEFRYRRVKPAARNP